MGEQLKISCVRPVSGPVIEEIQKGKDGKISGSVKEGRRMFIGRKAPDFTAPAYHNGSFVNIRLSDYLGKWVVLCFYPGDFTFV